MGTSSTVADYVTLLRGITYKGNLVGKPGPALLGLGSIQPGGGFRDADYKTYGGECPPRLMLYPGDLFVSLKGATKDGKMIGSVARVPPTVLSGRLTQDTVKLEFRKSDRDTSSFLYWILRTPHYREYCGGRATGSAVVALSRDDFLSYPVPPMSEERMRLVALLEALEEKLGLNRRMNETLEAIGQVVFKSWFVDSTRDGLPEGWHQTRLGEHVEITKGLSYKGSGLADRGVPLHNLNSIYEGGRYKHVGLKHYKGEYKERHICLPGDIIVANTEQGFDYLLIGYPAIVPRRYGNHGLFTHHIYRVRPKPGSSVTNHFVYFLLLNADVREQVIGHTNGTTVNALARTGLEQVMFPLPPRETVADFERNVAPIFEEQELLYEESCTLAALRDALLPKLVSGDLKVPEAEKSMEQVT